MENNIVHSIKEFPLVYFLAKNICDDMGVPLNDVKISKDGRDGSLAVGEKVSLGGLQIEMLQSVVMASCRSAGRNSLDMQASESISAGVGILQMVYGMSGLEGFDKSPLLRMDQFPGAFMIAKNILCPICEMPFFNIQVILEANSILHEKVESDVAHINSGILTAGGRDCALLACMISANGKNIQECFVKMLTNRSSFRLLRSSIAEIYDNEEDIFAFITMAYAYADISIHNHQDYLPSFMEKTASFTAPSFWIFGLIEKMLAPVRGVRDNIAAKWAPISHEVWDRIDERRKQLGLPHAPMEVMLRVQAAPFSQESSSKTLQSKLEDARLWKLKNKL